MFARAGSQARLPLLALAALAFFAFSFFTAVRPTIKPTDVSAATVPAAVVTVAQQRVDATSDQQPCGGKYVTGDLVGEADPATVYGTLCGTP